jgi:hypothetical protein
VKGQEWGGIRLFLIYKVRTIPKEHIPKRWGNLEEPLLHDKKSDNTKERIHAREFGEIPLSFNKEYGTSSNPADALPQIGKRQQLQMKQVH